MPSVLLLSFPVRLITLCPVGLRYCHLKVADNSESGTRHQAQLEATLASSSPQVLKRSQMQLKETMA